MSQKCLKTENHEGQRQGAQEGRKRDTGFDLPGRIEMDFRVNQKCLKTENHEGQRRGRRSERKRDVGFDLPGRIEMDFRVSTKRESRGTAAAGAAVHAGCHAAAGPPCGDSTE